LQATENEMSAKKYLNEKNLIAVSRIIIEMIKIGSPEGSILATKRII